MEIWAAALEQYRTAAGKELNDPLLPHPSSTVDLLTL